MPIFSAGSASVQIVPDFASAQRRIDEFFAAQKDISVGVKPDLSQAEMARVETELNSARGTATVNVNRDQLRSDISSAITDAVSSNVGLSSLSSLLSASFKPAVLSAIGGVLTELAAAASQAVGIVALIPAGIAAIAVPAATVAIGVQGMGAAFKALDSGNVTQINAAMAKLAPSAQDAITQVFALKPAFEGLRLDVQQQLFAGVGTAVTQLAQVALPVMRTGFTETASALNSGLLQAMTSLQQQGPAFANMFTNIAATIRTAGGAAPPLIAAFSTLGSVGSAFLPQLATGFVNVANSFDAWVQKSAAAGQLATLIQNAINVLKQLGDIAINVGKILGGVFEAALPFGNVLLGMLVNLTGGLATFVHSADGQSALTAFFSGVSQAVGALVGPLQTVVQAVVSFALPALGQLAAALAPIAGQLLTQFAAVLGQVAGIVPPVVQVVAALVSALAPLIPIIGQLITTILPPLLVVFNALAPVIGQITTAIGQALLQAVEAIIPFLVPIGTAFIAILQALLPLIPLAGQLAAALGGALAQAVLAVLQAISPVVPVFVSLAQTILPPLAAIFGQVVTAISPLIIAFGQGLAQAMQVLVPLFTPMIAALQQILTAVQPLIPMLVQLVQQAFAAWSKEMVTVIQATLPLLPLLGQLALQLIPPLVSVMSALIPVISQVGIIIAQALVQAITILAPLLPPLVKAFLDIVQAVLPLIPPLVQLGATILVAAAKAFAALVEALVPLLPQLVQLVQSLVPPLVDLMNRLGPLIPPLAAAFVKVVDAVVPLLPLIVSLVQQLLPPLINLITLLAPPLIILGTKFLDLAGTILKWVTDVIGWFADFGTKWNKFWTDIAQFIKDRWNDITSFVQTVWNGLATWFSGVWASFTTAWNNFWNAILSFFQNLWNGLVSWVQNLWNGLSGWFAGVWASFSTAWTNFWNGVLSFFQNLWNTLVSWVQNLWNGLQSWFSGVWAAFSGAWSTFWNNELTFFQGIWNTLVGWVQTVWNGLTGWFSGVWASFSTAWSNLWNDVSGAFQTAWNGIKTFAQTVWEDIKNVIETPVKFVVNTVIDGLIGGIDDVMKFLGLSFTIPKITLGFAEGGYTGAGINGTGGKYDPAGIVHAGEFVVNQQQTAKYMPLLAAINSGTQGFADGGLVGALPGYAVGGLVGEIAGLVTDPVGTITSFLKDLVGNGLGTGAIDQLAGAIPTKIAPLVGNWIGDKIKGALTSILSTAGSIANSVLSALGSAASGVLSALGISTGTSGSTAGNVTVAGFTGPAAVAQWGPDVLQVLTMLGRGAGEEGAVLRRIQFESGGNPNAINLTDSNALAGDPSRGLMQVIQTTFDAYRSAALANNIYDPMANIYAGSNYAVHRYGSLAAIDPLVKPTGYDSGGWLPPGYSSVFNGTGGFEAVLNGAQQQAVTSAVTSRQQDGTPVWHFHLGDREITDLVDARLSYQNTTDGRTLRSHR